MRPLPSALKESLASGATTLCWCWKLADSAGRVLGFTDHDCDLVFDGVTYEASSGFAASEAQSALGLGVGNLEIAGALHSGRLCEADLRAGLYDEAVLELWLVDWSDTVRRVMLRKGSLGEITRKGRGFIAEVRGIGHALARAQGRLYQYGCDAELGDARCGRSLASSEFTASGAVSSAESDSRFMASGLDGFEAGWFTRGMLVWTDGCNRQRNAEIRAHRLEGTRVAVELWHPTPSPIIAGDAFTIAAGCDKQFATCRSKFSNVSNFRGFPHMPGNDFVMSYAVAGD